MKPVVNREDLTFSEWRQAAECFGSTQLPLESLRQAWIAGEDPTEYAAIVSNSKKVK